MSDETQRHQSSFRDPAGFVFEHKGDIYRQINLAGSEDYEHFMGSGLYQKLVDEGFLVSHKEITDTAKFSDDKNRYKIIKPERVPFVSYPYEWTFRQLKDAALLTLKVQKLALKHSMILKDSSSFNVQFIGRKPIFIDTLSFWKYKEGEPWEGYKQFCEHFIAPLAISSHNSPDLIPMLRIFIDGVPLNIATQILPRRARLKRGLLAHVYLHAVSQKRYDRLEGAEPKARRKVSTMALNGLMASLEATVKRLSVSRRKTQWGDYYNDTNYSNYAFENKKRIVDQMLKKATPTPKLVWDMGANDGTFSDIAASLGAYTVAFDMDEVAVEQNYLKKDKLDNNILPLVQNLANPSPSLGWAHSERHSLEERGPADVVLALALIHHLTITNHAPFSAVAEFFARTGKYLIIEFVPKEDSKVQLLLSAFSHNMFEDYTPDNFEAAFSEHFKLVEKKSVEGSKRTMYLFASKIKP